MGLALCAAACRQPDDAPRAPAASQVATDDDPGSPVAVTASAAPSARSVDWASWRGRCVRVKGYAVGQKIGPRLQSGRFAVGVVRPGGPDDWGVPPGALVQVEGTVAERSDLPVFVAKPGEPVMQGMPVPEGTDLDAARRRWVLEARSVTLVHPLADVEATLASQVGRDVSLDGIVWSINGHYWFSHDGVDVHMAAREKIGGWESLHGQPITLHGRLERRPMPRIDELTLRADPALADAFVLELRERSPHPDWPVEACPEAH